MSNQETGRVFVVQKTMKFDPKLGELVPKFDLSLAKKYGDIEYLLSPTASPFRPESLLCELHQKLSSFSDNDYLLLIGNPVLIGMAVGIAADYTDGNVKVLQWSGRSNEYLPIEIKGLFTDCQPAGR